MGVKHEKHQVAEAFVELDKPAVEEPLMQASLYQNILILV